MNPHIPQQMRIFQVLKINKILKSESEVFNITNTNLTFGLKPAEIKQFYKDKNRDRNEYESQFSFKLKETVIEEEVINGSENESLESYENEGTLNQTMANMNFTQLSDTMQLTELNRSNKVLIMPTPNKVTKNKLQLQLNRIEQYISHPQSPNTSIRCFESNRKINNLRLPTKSMNQRKSILKNPSSDRSQNRNANKKVSIFIPIEETKYEFNECSSSCTSSSMTSESFNSSNGQRGHLWEEQIDSHESSVSKASRYDRSSYFDKMSARDEEFIGMFTKKSTYDPKKKQVQVFAIILQRYDYDDLSWCHKKMREGIVARKFHYSNHKQNQPFLYKSNYRNDRVKIWISNDGNKINWRKVNSQTQSLLDLTSSVKIKNIYGLIFGAFSSTFENHKEFVLNYQRFSRLTNQNNKRSSSQKGSSPGSNIKIRQRRQAKSYTMSLHQGDKHENNLQRSAALKTEDKIFYSWECVSLMTLKRTYDFVITERTEMLAFINCIQNIIYIHHLKRKQTITIPKYWYYKILMFKMKISYMAWVQKIQFSEVLLRAINKTVEQQKHQVIAELRAFRMTENIHQDVLEAKQQGILKRKSVFVTDKDQLQAKGSLLKRRETIAALLKEQLSKMNTYSNENPLQGYQKMQIFFSLILLKQNYKLHHLKKCALSHKFYIDNYLSSDEEEIQNKKKIARETIFEAKRLEQLVNEELRILNFRLQQVLNLKAKDAFFMISEDIRMFTKNKKKLVSLVFKLIQRKIIDEDNLLKKQKFKKQIEAKEFWRKAKNYRQLIQKEQKSQEFKNERQKILDNIKRIREKSFHHKASSQIPEFHKQSDVRAKSQINQEQGGQSIVYRQKEHSPLSKLWKQNMLRDHRNHPFEFGIPQTMKEVRVSRNIQSSFISKRREFRYAPKIEVQFEV
ncbi:UNKNOWN [Stylonychia lemnae]|uniref:Uncharacterized protein n=1 Tax=Stylonychia lemnae TaxID=5949 RepID=A0A078APE3_STYLE|nr:UNKNOWN [Stylonychia lemnae]|eukprot:CDW84009.1 UNKNOWN [Stylonychia lemnae]